MEIFPKFYLKLYQTNFTPLQHIITISANNLSKDKKELILTLTIAILTEIWTARNRLQYDNTNIPANKIIDNIKQSTRNIIRSHYKHNKLKNTLQQFENEFTINETYCKLINNEIIPTI